MKKTILYLAVTCSSALSTQAASLTLTAIIEGHKTSVAAGSTDITNGTTLGLLVLDTDGNGFGNILSGSSTSVGQYIGSNDLILNSISSTEADTFLETPAQIAGAVSLSIDLDVTGVDSGDRFAIYWFPTLTTSDGSFTTGDTHGIATDAGSANWALGAPSSTIIAGLNDAGTADFTVAAVPEPSSTALLGLGSAALLLRRRRK